QTMSEEKKLPPGWEMKKLGDICDISGGAVTLHPSTVVTPSLTICGECGKHVGLLLIVISEFKDICTSCDTVHYGGADKDSHGRKVCQKCGNYSFERGLIGEHEKFPIEICDDCKKLNEQVREMVKAGGIHFR